MIALLTPLSLTMEPAMAIVMMIGVFGATATGGSLTAILINTPGQSESAATVIDGFPLSKQGKAGYAIGAAVSASMFGGIFGAIILTLILPFGRYAVLAFSFQEYFMMAVMGLSLIAVLSSGSLWKGIISGCLGLLIATIGYDPVTGSVRYTFGTDYLWDGIKLTPALIGLFAITEGLEIFSKRKSIADVDFNNTKLTGIWEGMKAPFRYWKTFLRGSTLGTIVGIIPGVGGAVANFLAYGQEVQANKDRENFGKGDIRGVIAPESANNAKDGGALVPTLIFGIPGSATMAVFIGVMILHGIQPGPRLMLDNADIALYLIYTLVGSNILVAVMSLLAAKHLAKMTFISGTLIGPGIIVFAITGSYMTDFMVQDVIVALAFGILGFALKRYGYSLIALLIAMVLGEMMQKSFHQSILTSGWEGFFTRPISLALFIITVLLIVIPLVKKRKDQRTADSSDSLHS